MDLNPEISEQKEAKQNKDVNMRSLNILWQGRKGDLIKQIKQKMFSGCEGMHQTTRKI